MAKQPYMCKLGVTYHHSDTTPDVITDLEGNEFQKGKIIPSGSIIVVEENHAWTKTFIEKGALRHAKGLAAAKADGGIALNVSSDTSLDELDKLKKAQLVSVVEEAGHVPEEDETPITKMNKDELVELVAELHGIVE